MITYLFTIWLFLIIEGSEKCSLRKQNDYFSMYVLE